MSSTRTRQFALLAVAALALVAVVIPGFGTAQEATPAPDEAEASELIATGQQIYETLCVACHRPGGAGAEGTEGVPGIPALAGNPFVTLEDPRPVVATVLNGRAGMPAFRGFSDEEIAGVVSYIRQAFGNQAGPVDPALVAEVRAEYVVEPPPPATPITTPGPGEEATPAAESTPGEAEAVPTLGQ
jgi:mono/diheme cytochrome c family protein